MSTSAKSTSSKKSSASSRLTADMRIVALIGSDAYLRIEDAKAFAELLNKTYGGLQTFRFDGESVDLATLMDELRSFGLMERHKLVILDSADEFLAGQPSHRAAFERYLEKPVEDATLMLRATSMKMTGRFERALQAAGAVRSCDPPTEAGAVKWCILRGEKQYAATVEPDAAALLVQRLGTDLAHLDSELGKLTNAVDPGQPVTAEAVRAMVGMSREEKAWILEEAILTGEPRRALMQQRQLQDVSRIADELVRWVQMDLCRKAHAVARMAESGHVDFGAMRAIGIYTPPSQQAIRRVANPPAARFAQLLRRCVEADAAVKGGRANQPRSLESMTALIADTI